MYDLLDLLQQATLKLAQSGSIKDRLADAYTKHLAELDANELPERYRSEFNEMRAALHRERPLPRECAVRASVRKMSNEEAARYATLVVQVFATLARGATVTTARRKPRKAQATPIIKVSPIAKLFARDG
jgi:hypothetical protein